MTFGALQILLKSARTMPSGQLALAGSGPLLYLFAGQCVEVGVQRLTLLDTAAPRRMLSAFPLLPRAFAREDWRYRATPPAPRSRPGAHLIFLPHSPDLSPIEQVFAKLKHLMRKAQPREVEATRRRAGQRLNLFSAKECAEYLAKAGYAPV